MNENANVEFSTGKRFALDAIGGFMLWEILYSIGWAFIVILLSYLITLSPISYEIGSLLTVVLEIVLFFIFQRACWKDAVKSAFKRGQIYKKDVAIVKKGITIFLVICTIISVVWSGIDGYNEIKDLKYSFNGLDKYLEVNGEDASIRKAHTSVKNQIIGAYILAIGSPILTILINVYMLKFVTRLVLLSATEDVKEGELNVQSINTASGTRRVSLFVTAIIVYALILVISVLIAVIVVISNLGTDDMKNSINNMNNLLDSLEKLTIEDVRQVATMALQEAKKDNTIDTDEEYYNYVIEYMKNLGIKVSDYDITVTKSGVTVSEKKEDDVTDNNNDNGENAEPKPDNDTTTQKPEEDKIPDTPARGSKLDSTKDWVYTQYNDAENKLPKLNMYSPYAEKINKEIETKLLQDIKSGNSYGIASYQWHINNNILSLVIDNKGPNDLHLYYIYNINMDTGDAYTNAELLKLKGLVENDFATKLRNACAAKFLEDYGMDNTLEFYIDSYKNTLEKTYNKDAKMYLNSSGDLVAVGYVYAVAGPQGHDRLFNITSEKPNYAPWMTYILNQNIESITATKYKDDVNVVSKVELTKEQLKDVFSKLVDYKLIKTCLGSGFSGKEIVISYSVNNREYELRVSQNISRFGDDKGLNIALENSKSEVQGEADETEYYYRFQEYDFTILDKYFE